MTYEEYLKKTKDIYAAERQKAIDDSNTVYDTQTKQVNEKYQNAIDEAKLDYEDLYRENSVQKLINERKIARDMAESGLTDSGLNRTQQTAVQLSYGNANMKINTQRQKAIDSLSQQLAEQLSNISINKLSAASSIGQSYDKLAADAAQSAYKAEVDAETERQKAYYSYLSKAASAAAKTKQNIIATNGGLLSRNYTGTLQENGVSVYKNANGQYVYVDNVTGKKTTLAAGVNPYVGGDIHKDAMTNGKYDPKKVFSNGYQPNNINGNKLAKVDEVPVKGNLQAVWQTVVNSSGRRAVVKNWVWDGSINDYVRVEKDVSGDWTVV